MPAFICTTCGTQFPPADEPPKSCRICSDERQYVGLTGQGWTTAEKLALAHFNAWHEYVPGILGIGTQPRFAIGQRAILMRTEHGNVLWDCVSLLDAATISLIKALGGLTAMAISHPHFYSTMGEWSRAFDVPVHIHADDREHVVYPHGNLKWWEGETLALTSDVTLIRGGGHFSGSSMLHWAKGAGGRGIICASDTAYVAPDKAHVSFMRSYPNFLPLPARNVKKIAGALAPYKFDMMFGNFFESVIESGASESVQKSADRYLAAIATDAEF